MSVAPRSECAFLPDDLHRQPAPLRAIAHLAGEPVVRKLNYDLWRLQQGSRDGSHGTRRERSYVLAQAANLLHEEGFRGLRAKNLKGRHVEALVRAWRRRGVSDATVMNRLAHVRWWAAKVDKPNVVQANAAYGVRPRSHVADGTRRRDLDEQKLAGVKDEHVKMALRLQAAFGLRREEAIKFCLWRVKQGENARQPG